MNEIDDMIGKQFGTWNVIARDDNDKTGNKIYSIQCLCGRLNKRRSCDIKKVIACKYCKNKRSIKENQIKERYGKLKVISTHVLYIDGKARVECLCDCGKKVIKRVYELKKRSNSACSISCVQTKDLKNKRFARLKVIEFSGYNQTNNSMWKCLCDCGKIKIISNHDLQTGFTKSCGCLMKENAKEQIKRMIYSENVLFLKCLYCEKKFTTRHKRKKFCCNTCALTFHRKKRKEMLNERPKRKKYHPELNFLENRIGYDNIFLS